MADFNYFQAIMYLILYILIICFIGIIIYGVKKYKSEKRIGGIFVTIIVSLLLLYGINQLAIFNLFFSNKTSFAQGDYKKAAFYTGIAAKLALYPSQKSTLYGELGQIFMTMKDSNNAIKCFEKAYKINGNSYKISKKSSNQIPWQVFAAMLYTYSEDYNEVYKIADDAKLYQFATNAAILEKDYQKALGYANLSIIKSPKATEYSRRAYIYKKLNKNNLAQQDLNSAITLCKGNIKCLELNQKILNDNFQLEFQKKGKEKFGLN